MRSADPARIAPGFEGLPEVLSLKVSELTRAIDAAVRAEVDFTTVLVARRRLEELRAQLETAERIKRVNYQLGAAMVRSSSSAKTYELASLVRDTGLATEAFPIGRIHTLYKSVATNDQLTLPGFVNLLLLIAVHRANPKFGTVGKADASSISSPLPGCLDSILKKNILKSKKQEKQAAVKKEVKTLDTGKLFKASRDKLKKGFDDACKAREKGRSLCAPPHACQLEA